MNEHIMQFFAETAEQLRTRLTDRVKWLENELRLHDAYKLEVDVLKRMLAAELPSEVKP